MQAPAAVHLFALIDLLAGLRKGDWRPETAKGKMAQIRLDLIDRFGDHPFDSFDKFTLQTHLNSLAERYSQDRVKQARSYLKSIFEEAIEQEFLVKTRAGSREFLRIFGPRISRS